MIQFSKDLIKNFSALITLVEFELKSSISSSRLGWAWWVMNPLFMMAIYYFFVSMILQRSEENYHLFILVGIIVWQSFSGAINQSTTAIQRNSSLIKQTPIPLSIIVLIPTLVQTFYCLVGLALVLILNFNSIGIHTFTLPLLIFTFMLSSYSFGLYFAVFNVFIKDTRQLIAYLMRAGFFLSPILFASNRILDNIAIPDAIKALYQLNPMAWIIPAFRDILLDGQSINFKSILIVLICMFILAQSGLVFIRSQNNNIIKSV